MQESSIFMLISDGCLYPVRLRSYNNYESLGLPTSLRIFHNNHFQCSVRVVGWQFYAESVGYFYAGIYRHEADGRYIVVRSYRLVIVMVNIRYVVRLIRLVNVFDNRSRYATSL